MELETLRDEVVFKVGRNVLLFQELESVLKWLAPRLEIAGNTPDEIALRFQKSKQSSSKRTLGMNAGELLSSGESVTSPHRFSFLASMKFTPETRAEIEELIEGRNTLVHHFFNDIDAGSCESWQEAAQRLDSQKDRVIEITKLMRDMANGLRSGYEHLVKEFLNDRESKS